MIESKYQSLENAFWVYDLKITFKVQSFVRIDFVSYEVLAYDWLLNFDICNLLQFAPLKKLFWPKYLFLFKG